MSEEINFDDVEFGEPIEEREPNYRDGYIRGIYRAKNIIDSKQREIERLNKQLQLISDEFLKYDWENSSKKQIINQLKSLYNSIFKGSESNE